MANAWLSVARTDAKRILRDRFLLLIVVYLPLMAIAFRWAIPALAEAVAGDVDLPAYYPVVNAILVLILPFIMGAVLGLQLLEEKDERALFAVAMTPFSLRRYVFFRLGVYAFFGTLLLVLSHEVMGLVDIPLPQLLVIALGFGLNAGLSAFMIAIVAKNQVQGFAVLKGSGFLFAVPVLSWFVPHHWDLLFGVLPFYWPIKAYYVAVSGGPTALFWGAVAASLVVQLAVFALLYRVFWRRLMRV